MPSTIFSKNNNKKKINKNLLLIKTNMLKWAVNGVPSQIPTHVANAANSMTDELAHPHPFYGYDAAFAVTCKSATSCLFLDKLARVRESSVP